MTTSPITQVLSKPHGREPIPASVFAYLETRNRMRAFSLVHQEFGDAGISQTDLAARMVKGTDRICQLLGAPGNWTLDTLCDFVFAIRGGIVRYSIEYPLDKARRNQRFPAWLTEDGAQTERPDFYFINLDGGTTTSLTPNTFTQAIQSER